MQYLLSQDELDSLKRRKISEEEWIKWNENADKAVSIAVRELGVLIDHRLPEGTGKQFRDILVQCFNTFKEVHSKIKEQ